jgi:hypothetical protein
VPQQQRQQIYAKVYSSVFQPFLVCGTLEVKIGGTLYGLAEKHRFCYFRFKQIYQKLNFNRQIFFQMLQNGIEQI